MTLVDGWMDGRRVPSSCGWPDCPIFPKNAFLKTLTQKRAFPSLLGLERELHMTGVVQYLKKLGVQNVGRFVSRLPPVLGYDVNTNLIPKVQNGVSDICVATSWFQRFTALRYNILTGSSNCCAATAWLTVCICVLFKQFLCRQVGSLHFSSIYQTVHINVRHGMLWLCLCCILPLLPFLAMEWPFRRFFRLFFSFKRANGLYSRWIN